jgi:peroxiredoxin
LDLAFDGTAIFGGPRSKRYAIEIGEDGKVKAMHVEPDNTGLNGKLFPKFSRSIINSPLVSAAEKVLG